MIRASPAGGQHGPGGRMLYQGRFAPAGAGHAIITKLLLVIERTRQDVRTHHLARLRRLRRPAALGRAHGPDRCAARLRRGPGRCPGACAGHPPAGLRRRPGHHRGAAEQHRHRPDDHRLRRRRRGRPGPGPGRHAGRQRRHHPDRPAAVLRPDLAGAHPDPGRRLDVPSLPARPHPRPGPRLHRPGPAAAVAAPAGAAVRAVPERAHAGHGAGSLVHPAGGGRAAVGDLHLGRALQRGRGGAGHVAGQPSHGGAARGLRAGAGRQPGHRHQSHDRGRHRR